jgi:hypothetical protein
MAIADAARDFVQKNTGNSTAAGSVADAASSFEALLKGDKNAASKVAIDYSYKVVETVVAAIPVFGPLVSTALGFLKGIFGGGAPAIITVNPTEQARVENPGRCLLAFVRLGFLGEDGLSIDNSINPGHPARPSLSSSAKGPAYGLSVRDLIRRYLLVIRPDLLIPGSNPGPAWAHELAYFYTTLPGVICSSGSVGPYGGGGITSFPTTNPVQLDYDPPNVSDPTTNPNFANLQYCANLFNQSIIPPNGTWCRCGELWGNINGALLDCYHKIGAVYYGQWQQDGPYSIANTVSYLTVMQICEQERQKAIQIKIDADKLAAGQRALLAKGVSANLLAYKKKALVVRSAPKPLSKPVKGLLVGSTLAVGGIVAWEYRRQLMKLFIR